MLCESNRDIESQEILERFLDACDTKSSTKLIKAIFFHPLQNKNIKKIGRFIMSTILLILITGIVLRVYVELTNKPINTVTLAPTIFELLSSTPVFFIYMLVMFKENQVIKGYQLMSKMWFFKSFSEQQTMSKTTKKGLYYSQFMAVSIIVLANCFVSSTYVPSIISNQTFKNNFPLHTNYFIDEEKHFYSVFIVDFCGINIVALLIGSFTVMQCFCISFLIAEIYNLQYHLKMMDFKYEHKIQKSRKNACTELNEDMKEVIKKHYQCIQLFEILDSISGPVMFAAIVGTCSNLAITGAWTIILMQINQGEAIKMFFGYWMAAITLIIACIPGQLLSNASDTLFAKIYFIKWQIYPPKIRPMIIMFMLRGIRPFELSAGPTISLNFETCSQILKTTLSYIAAFRSIYDLN